MLDILWMFLLSLFLLVWLYIMARVVTRAIIKSMNELKKERTNHGRQGQEEA